MENTILTARIISILIKRNNRFFSDTFCPVFKPRLTPGMEVKTNIRANRTLTYPMEYGKRLGVLVPRMIYEITVAVAINTIAVSEMRIER